MYKYKMNLLTDELLNKTKEYYKLKEYPIFHQVISLIISQKISFSQGRLIRKNIFNHINEEFFTKNNLEKINPDQFTKFGLDDAKIKIISNIINIEYKNNEDFITKISNIKGIGPWTIKSLKIMFDLKFDPSENEFLFEDLWIRKRVSELLKIEKVITQSECKNISNCIKNKRIKSIFFWRIKPEGIKKILKNENLKREDFV
jgi:3-methyladenine DNA glycosylase/8-oxoguanine DNA glycosylase